MVILATYLHFIDFASLAKSMVTKVFSGMSLVECNNKNANCNNSFFLRQASLSRFLSGLDH